MMTSAAACRLTSASMRCFKGSCSGMFSWMKSACCAITCRSVVNDNLPFGGRGAEVRRARAGSALATAPRIHSSISGLTSAAMTSTPKCRARAAHPPPMTPVPSRPSVFTFRIVRPRWHHDIRNCHDYNIKMAIEAAARRRSILLRGITQHARDRHGRLGLGGVIILADEGRDGRSDLRLGNRAHVGSLAERSRVRANDRDPDILRAPLLDAVFLPFSEAAAPPMIGGDDESRCATVLRHGLHGVPQLFHQMVHPVRAVENQIVAALVRPVVGLAVPYEQDARVRGLDIVQKGHLQKGIPDVFLVEARRR